jgi:hypothetical protein
MQAMPVQRGKPNGLIELAQPASFIFADWVNCCFYKPDPLTRPMIRQLDLG